MLSRLRKYFRKWKYLRKWKLSKKLESVSVSEIEMILESISFEKVVVIKNESIWEIESGYESEYI